MNRKMFAKNLVIGIAITFGACNKSQFRAGPARGGQVPGPSPVEMKDGPELPQDSAPKPLDPGKLNPKIDADQSGGEPTPILIFERETVAAVGVQELKQEADRFAWTVTQNGTATYFKIVGDAVSTSKKWTGAAPIASGGARTYVLEGGALVIVRTGGELFFIDPAKPEGNLRTMGSPYYQKLSVAGRTFDDDDRGCAVSYRRLGKKFIGIGIGNIGDFIEVPQADSPPFAPNWSGATYRGGVNPLGSGWGYSCFIDQRQLIYYGAWVKQPVKAFNLVTGLEVDPTKVATNGAFSSTTISTLTLGPKSPGTGSYAISGDNKGNVLSGNAYTMAFDAVNQVVWVTSQSGTQISLYPSACFSTSQVCVGSSTFMLAAGGGRGIGPMSALGDGSVLGLSRAGGYGGDNSLYRLTLKDPKDISKGIDIKKLAQLDGDPYMYTDFTGATLYLSKAEQKIELKKLGYKPEEPLAGVGFTWVTRDGQPAEWNDISLEMRCYASSDPSPPAYEKPSEAIQSSTKQSFVSTPSCAKGRKGIDLIDVRLTQLNNANTLMNIRKIQVTAYQ
jgi:hypothetical protein